MNLYAQFKIPQLLFQSALVLATLATMVLAFAPIDRTVAISDSDKHNHFIAFFVLSMLLDGAHRATHFNLAKIACLLTYALFIELVQSIIPYRDFSWLDMLSDLAGILVYGVCIHSVTYIISKR